MARIYVFLLLITSSLLPLTAASQSTGRLSGRVTDKTTGEGVYGAMVIVTGTPKATPTDADGQYTLELAPGTYAISINSVGFKPQQFSGIQVAAGQTTTLSTALVDAIQLATATVVGQKQTGTDISLIKDLRQSQVVVSGVSSEQITKTQDRDAAEVVKRIPGVTIQDSRFILVRGLAERYNTVMLNDALAPSSEADVRAFSFDALPSSAIDRILVFKSAAPELPGDFAGGVVKVYTRNSATQNATLVNVSSSYRAGTTLRSFLTSDRSKTDFLGFDSGLRTMPGAFPKSLTELSVNERVEAARQLSTGSWAPQRTTASPDLRLSLGLTRVFDLKSAQITTVTALSYSNTHEQVDIQRNGYENYDAALGRSRQAFSYQDQRGTQNTRLGIVHNWAARLNSRNKLEFRNLLNQIGSNQITVRKGFNYANELEVGEAVGLRYDSRMIYAGQLQGTHDLADERTTLTWTAGYAYTNRQQPDYRQYSYSRTIGSDRPYTIGITSTPNAREGGRFFSTLNEHTVMASGQWERRFGNDSTRQPDQQPKLRAGFYAEQKNRAFDARWPAFTKARFDSFDNSLLTLPIDRIFAPENINPTTGFALSEGSNPSNHYQAGNTLGAAYVGGILPVGEHLTLTGGVRVEAYRVNLTSATYEGPVTVDTLQLAVLPSVNSTWNFSPRSLLRVAASKTLNRPEFRELAPFNFYDFEQNAEIQGNPKLRPASIYNADVRYEFYPAAGEMLSVGVFGKHFDSPIEKLILPSGSLIYNFQNTRSAWSAGVEVEARQTFAKVSQNPFFQRLGLTLNASLIASRVQLTATQSKVQQSDRRLQGQSPYIVNTGLFYQDDESGWQASLLYNVAGPRIWAVGAISQDPDIYEMPRHQIDLSVAKRFGQHLEVKAGVQDLLNQRIQLTQDTNTDGRITSADESIAGFRRGQYGTTSLTWRF